MDSIFLAIAVAVLVWLFMRRARLRAQRRPMTRPTAEGKIEEPQSMPRFGRPGTVSREQSKALKELRFEPSRQWSFEEAQLILDSVAYLRVVIEKETGETDTPLEVQNKILAVILTDEALRDYILDWSRNRTREELTSDRPTLPAGAEYDRIAAVVGELWEAE